MRNKGGQEDGCCCVLVWDTGDRDLFFILNSFFLQRISVLAKYAFYVVADPDLHKFELLDTDLDPGGQK